MINTGGLLEFLLKLHYLSGGGIYMTNFYIPKSVAEAREIQDSLRLKLKITNDFGKLNTIAGVDVGYDKALSLAHASVVLMSYPELQVISQVQAFVPANFPYVPGYLSFREIPAILAALAKLPYMPSLFMADGQGIAHPRRMGIAAHLGLFLDVPSLGVAKSCLVGQYAMPGPEKSEASMLVDKGECIGVVLRSKERCKPLFISPGHKVDIETSVAITTNCLTRYRLPEPTRLADKFSKVKKA